MLFYRYYHANKPTTLPVILALLYLSTKYDIPSIWGEVKRHLELYYPSDPSKWSRNPDTPLYSDGYILPKDAGFQLLAAVRHCGPFSIMPMLCYECAVKPFYFIFRCYDILDPNENDFERVVVGRERLLKYSYEFGEKALFPQEKCQFRNCSETRTEMLVKWMDLDEDGPPRLVLDACLDGLKGIGDIEDHEDLCLACLQKSKEVLQEFQKMLWTNLPDLFGLIEWEELRPY